MNKTTLLLWLLPILWLSACVHSRSAISPSHTFIVVEQQDILTQGVSEIRQLRTQLKTQLPYLGDGDRRKLLLRALDRGHEALAFRQQEFLSLYEKPLSGLHNLREPVQLHEAGRISAQTMFYSLLAKYTQTKQELTSSDIEIDVLEKKTLNVLDSHKSVFQEVISNGNTRYQIKIHSNPPGASFYLTYLGNSFNEKKPDGKTNDDDVWIDYVPYHILIRREGYQDEHRDFDPSGPHSTDSDLISVDLRPVTTSAQKNH